MLVLCICTYFAISWDITLSAKCIANNFHHVSIYPDDCNYYKDLSTIKNIR